MVVHLQKHVTDVDEILGISSLGDVEDLIFRVLDNMRNAVLLAVSGVGDVSADLDQTAQNALVLYDLGIVLYVHGTGDNVAQMSDIVLAARLLVNTHANKCVNERYGVDLIVFRVKLLHGKKDLLVLADVKIRALYRSRDLVEGIGVDKDTAQQRLLRHHGKGKLSD